MSKEQMSVVEDGVFNTNQLLTKREVIEEILESVSAELWSGDDKLVETTATLVGLDIAGHSDGHGLFWKKVSRPT